MHRTFESLIGEYCQKLGLKAHIDPQKGVDLTLNGTVHVHFKPKTKKEFIVFSYLNVLKGALDKDNLKKLMQFNFALSKVQNATIALHKETRQLIFYKTVHLSFTQLSDFEESMKSFVNQVEVWRKKITEK